MLADHAVLAVDGDAGEISHMLVRTGQLVEEGGFTAVLISHKGEGENGFLRKRCAGALRMEAALLTEAGVFCLLPLFGRILGAVAAFQRFHADLFGVRDPESQFIAVNAKLHRVA